jgi:serine/threonine protein kinase
MQFIRTYVAGISLSCIVAASPEWWTPTVRAKVVVGLVLGLRFAHSLGLLHGHLTGDNVFFIENGMIQITDFGLTGLAALVRDHGSETDVGNFSGESWRPTADVRSFRKLLSEIVVGAPADEGGRDPGIPFFVSEMINREQSTDLHTAESFAQLLKELKEHEFEILEGVEVQEVSNFVRWIESTEMLTE